jgi:hypothetical protein
MGAHAMTGFQSHVSRDVPPFMMVDGHPLAVRGFNSEGLRRRGYSPSASPWSSRCTACSIAPASPSTTRPGRSGPLPPTGPRRATTSV